MPLTKIAALNQKLSSLNGRHSLTKQTPTKSVPILDNYIPISAFLNSTNLLRLIEF